MEADSQDHIGRVEASPRARWHALAAEGLARGLGNVVDEDGRAPEGLEDVVAEAVGNAVRETAAAVVDTLRETAPEMLEDHAQVWQAVHDEIRAVWGDALDSYYAVVVCADESSRYFVNDQVAAAERDGDTRFAALSGLLAQGCRVALEVWHLLSSGFASGAAARVRTLHELNVLATVLAEHGRTDRLAERFVAHTAVDEPRYFRSVADDDDPGDQETLRWLEGEVASLCDEFGPSFRGPNGWAAALLANPRPKFRDLEDLAGLGDWREVYIEASHAVHPSALGSRMNMEEGGMVTSWRLSGLADPAISALGSLCHLVATVFTSPDDVNTMDLVAMSALVTMSETAQDSLRAASVRADDVLASERVHPEPAWRRDRPDRGD